MEIAVGIWTASETSISSVRERRATPWPWPVEDALGERLTDGIAVVKILEPGDRFVRTRVRIGGHPIPNQAGYEACLEILDLIDRAGPEDLFLCVMSGGSSALMSCPVDGISLEDEQKTTDILLKSGAGILEINAVRRHISRMNGGRMAQRIADRGAELIGFNISDSVSNPPTRDISIPWEHYYGTPWARTRPPFRTLWPASKSTISTAACRRP